MSISANRVTQFALNGAMWRPYGSFAGKTEQTPAPAAAPGGVGKRYKRRKRVMIGRKLYWVSSAYEEALLVQSYIRELEEQRQQAQAPERRRSLAVKIKRQTTRLRAFDLDVPLEVPDDEDEVLTLFAGTRVLH